MDRPESGNIAQRNGVCGVKVRRELTWTELTWTELTWLELPWLELTWVEPTWAVGRKWRSAGLRAEEWT